jgi:MYXO-CTERM domain-containing protein
MWLDDGTSVVRGVMFIGNGASYDGRWRVYEAHYRAVARRHGFALIASSKLGNFGAEDEWSTFLSDVTWFSQESGHAELSNAPFATFGHSNGGSQAYAFAYRIPERTIAFSTNKGCCPIGGTSVPPPDAALKVPGMFIAGALDSEERSTMNRTLFETQRARGGLRAWFEEWAADHVDSDELDQYIVAFLDEMIRLRYPTGAPTANAAPVLRDLDPSTGWLVDKDWDTGMSTIVPQCAFSGDPLSMGWVANERMARIYRAVASYDPAVNSIGGKLVRFTKPIFLRGSNVEVPTAPGTVTLELAIDAASPWTSIEMFDWARPFATLTGGGATVSTALEVSGAAGHALHGIVHFVDGSVRTTAMRYLAANGSVLEPVAAEPEPCGVAGAVGHGGASSGNGGGAAAGAGAVANAAGGASGGIGAAASAGTGEGGAVSSDGNANGDGCACRVGSSRPATPAAPLLVLGLLLVKNLRRPRSTRSTIMRR